MLHTEWRNFKINIIDTAGLDDLVGETIPALRVADTCVLLMNSHKEEEYATRTQGRHKLSLRPPPTQGRRNSSSGKEGAWFLYTVQ